MTLGPILPGRIPNTLVGNRLTTNLQDATRSITKLQEQISTGQRFFVASEAPSAALRTIGYQRLLERKTHAQTNVQANVSLLGASDAALTSVSDALNRAKGILLEGTGSSAAPAEKEALALEVDALLNQVLGAANTQTQGRFLFAGTANTQPPFVLQKDSTILYRGNDNQTNSLIDLNSLMANSIDGQSVFTTYSTPITSDINPALTSNTRLADLHEGRGLTLSPIQITVSDPTIPSTVTQTVDLAGSQTVGDIQARIEAAFAGQPVTLSVGISGTEDGLELTSSSATATIAVADVTGSLTAANLGIKSPAATTITGHDLDPLLTLSTRLSDLNGGAGVTATAGQGLLISNGSRSATIDVSTATTVEDLFNLIKQADLGVDVGINTAGDGIAIRNKLSGAALSIGENGETTAADLGIRTFSANTTLAELDFGQGASTDWSTPLRITRRDGTETVIDLSSAKNIQNVIDTVNAVDPGNLVISVATVGNGLVLTDNSGTGPLTVSESTVSTTLGIAGTESTVSAVAPLVGKDPNQQQVPGVFTLLTQLRDALRSGDDRTLARLDSVIDKQLVQINQARGEVGGRLQALERTSNQLADDSIRIRESLSFDFDTDITKALTDFSYQQFTLQATLQVASQTMRLSLITLL